MLAAVCMLLICLLATARGADPAATGPETEKRFPPLKIPSGFRATLYACDPLVEYPSVIALGPRVGTLFVAYDYMTGLGLEIVRRDEIRVLRDSNADGYADESVVYAAGFNSIQGLAYHAGYVYVMHAPLLTRLRDTTADDVADERVDMLRGLGLSPEENPNRLHCANGVVVGHDGWLYLALGDRGCDVTRPEGDRLLVHEGCILRCRSDGSDLHLFSRGLRNIYDVALDAELNVFVRDNENDGGDYMIRVCHCFHSSDHGYPYLYKDRPDEAMPPLADLGRGSSAGGAAYLESAFPEEFRQSLYFCEWGRAVVRYRKQRVAGSFAPMQEVDFAAGASDDPYGFKPTDLVVDRDGSLLISDWCDGQRPKRGRGRIYRITAVAADSDTQRTHDEPDNFSSASDRALVDGINSNSYHVRVVAQEAIQKLGIDGRRILRSALQSGQVNRLGRLHAVWVLAAGGGVQALDDLLRLAEHDVDASIRAQAVRALADLTDPILTHHRLDARRGDEELCRRFAQIAIGADPQIQLEVAIALGRLHWSDAPSWLGRYWNHSDSALEHAGMLLLRHSENWPAVLQLLDEPSGGSTPRQSAIRTLALRALAQQATTTVADGLLERLKLETDPRRRGETIDLLARIYKRPAEWVYWGFRPAPRPANTITWDRSVAIESALDSTLGDVDPNVRVLAARRMLREEVPMRLETLANWLSNETSAECVGAILDALQSLPVEKARGLLSEIVRNKSRSQEHRIRALGRFVTDLDEESSSSLLEMATELEESPLLVEVLREVGRRPKLDSSKVLLAWLNSQSADVRAAAATALASQPVAAAAPWVDRLLRDADVRVRRAGAKLCGKLELRSSVDLLLSHAVDGDLDLQNESLETLRIIREPRALPLAVIALRVPQTQLVALSYLADMGSSQELNAVVATAAQTRSADVLAAAVRTLTSWQQKAPGDSKDWEHFERAVSALQGSSGSFLRWRVRGPMASEAANNVLKESMRENSNQLATPAARDWQIMFAEGINAQIRLPETVTAVTETVWLANTDFDVGASEDVEFLGSVEGVLSVWVNGVSVFTRDTLSTFQPDSDRFSVALRKGTNRLMVRIEGKEEIPFQMHFRHKSSQTDLERITQIALKERGNALRGRELFLNAEKTLCAKCHRITREGSVVGPDLSEIGSRFSRVHLIESILSPSLTVAPSYEAWVVALDNGRVLTGVKVSETATQLTLGDNQGQTHAIQKSAIEESRALPTSMMPDDVHKRLTDNEFVDLVEFLVSLKKAPVN